MYRIVVLVTILALLAGCWVYLSPTTYRCSDIDSLYEYRIQPPPVDAVWGMTKEEVREEYNISGSSLSLDDKEKDLIYFSFDNCPAWRYRFENNRLVAIGYLVMEAGIWSYIEKKI